MQTLQRSSPRCNCKFVRLNSIEILQRQSEESIFILWCRSIDRTAQLVDSVHVSTNVSMNLDVRIYRHMKEVSITGFIITRVWSELLLVWGATHRTRSRMRSATKTEYAYARTLHQKHLIHSETNTASQQEFTNQGSMDIEKTLMPWCRTTPGKPNTMAASYWYGNWISCWARPIKSTCADLATDVIENTGSNGYSSKIQDNKILSMLLQTLVAKGSRTASPFRHKQLSLQVNKKRQWRQKQRSRKTVKIVNSIIAPPDKPVPRMLTKHKIRKIRGQGRKRHGENRKPLYRAHQAGCHGLNFNYMIPGKECTSTFCPLTKRFRTAAGLRYSKSHSNHQKVQSDNK